MTDEKTRGGTAMAICCLSEGFNTDGAQVGNGIIEAYALRLTDEDSESAAEEVIIDNMLLTF